jgi:hypothetical protein
MLPPPHASVNVSVTVSGATHTRAIVQSTIIANYTISL